MPQLKPSSGPASLDTATMGRVITEKGQLSVILQSIDSSLTSELSVILQSFDSILRRRSATPFIILTTPMKY